MKKVRNGLIKNLRHLCLIGVIALGLMTIIGTGGGGGGGGGTTTTTDTTTPTEDTTGTLRTYKIGDTVTYQVTEDYDYPSDVTYSGDLIYAIDKEVTNPFGITCLSYTLSGTMTAEGTSVPIRIKGLFYQDEEGNMFDCGQYDEDNNEYIFVQETSDATNGLALEMKSPVTVGDVISRTVYYDDDSWQDCTFRVEGKEAVETLIAVYEAYEISVSCSDSDGVIQTGTDWLYPSIYYVKRHHYLRSSDYIGEVTYTLKDYSYVD